MNSHWPKVKLDELLRQRKEFVTIDDLRTYRRPRVQLHAQGIVLRDEIPGALIKTKEQQVCNAGEFLVAEIDAKVGGYGIVPELLDGSIVSSHYFLFAIDPKKLAETNRRDAGPSAKGGVITSDPTMAERMPALFIGHGNPMNALLVNPYTQRWAAIGTTLPRAKAILSISAHWYIEDAAVTVSTAPRTIHDFGGFPRELYRVQYPAPGDPNLAARVQHLLAPVPVRRDDGWGLDHGTWSVLHHIYPQADIPVVQLSIDETQTASFHYQIGERLAPLREEGVLILGSGNVVHNLHAYAWGRHATEPYDWAISFETRVRELLLAGEYKPLVNYEHQLGSEAELAVPTPDHYLPLLYVAGTRTSSEPLTFPVEGVDGGSVSMLAVQVG